MATEKETELLQELVDCFHTLLDETLILAIASDFDLTDPSAFQKARNSLQELAHNVPSEESSGFNPSGIPVVSGQDVHARQHERAATSTTSESRHTLGAHATDKSSTDGSSVSLETPDIAPRLTSFNKDSEEDKLLLLQSMFVDLKEFDVKFSLRKANGDFQSALDDLLNVQYLQSTSQQMKGIDGFFAPDDETTKAKRSKKKKGRRGSASESGSSSGGTPSQRASLESQGTQGQNEIAFIAERFGIRSEEVAPIYHKAQGSKSVTVVDLLNQYMSHGIETQDVEGKETAETLAKRYRHVPEKFMPTIVQVAGSIPQFADDIAVLLNKHFQKQSKGKKLDLAYRITPLPHNDIEGGTQTAQAQSPRPAEPISKSTGFRTQGFDDAMSRAHRHDQARRDAEASAAQMYRRGASTPLYRQAASYYKDLAREQARYAQSAASTAADMRVDGQSTRSSVDLHGVLVHDGVRIARQRVEDWWQGLGEARARKVREQGGFTVITGLGRHSAGGVSRLRVAVAAALLQDGWKLSVETGKFVVLGRR